MEKNQSSLKPQYSVYGRFKKAITFSNPLQQSPPSPPPPVNYPNSPEYPKPLTTKPVPIEFDHSVFSKVKKNRPVFVGFKDYKTVRATGGVESSEHGGVVEGEERGGTGGGNNQFSEYIKRAKMKMRRNMTVVGSDGGERAGHHGKGVSRLESINRNMSAYMDRAKAKMKSSTVSGTGKKPE